MLAKLISTALVVYNSVFTPSNTVFKSGATMNCNTTSVFNYINATLIPENPKINEMFVLTVGFTNNYQVISSGTIDYTVNYNGLPYGFTEPLCSAYLHCPVDFGEHTVSSNPLSIDREGKIIMTEEWKSDLGESLLCVKTSITIKSQNIENGSLVATSEASINEIQANSVNGNSSLVPVFYVSGSNTENDTYEKEAIVSNQDTRRYLRKSVN